MNNYINQLQQLTSEDDLIITPSDLHFPIEKPQKLPLFIQKTKRSIGYCPQEKLPFELEDEITGADCYIEKATAAQLGLQLLQLLFSGRSYLSFQLPERSEIRQLFFYLNTDLKATNYLLKVEKPRQYASYTYMANTETERYPLADKHYNDADLPLFTWGSSQRQAHYNKRMFSIADQLIVQLNTTSLSALVAVLLDASLLGNLQNEYCFENPRLGVGGTHPNSIEALFWLPGSIAFPEENLEKLKF